MNGLGRRRFLSAGLATAAGLTACTSPAPTEAKPKAAAFDPHDWDDVRALFPLDRKLIHTAAFVFAAHPKPVRDAIERHRRGLDLDTHAYLDAHHAAESEVRRAAASYLGGTPEQVA